MKKIDEKILDEISRYKSINNYIVEQEAVPPPPPADPAAAPPADAGAAPLPPADPSAVPPPPGDVTAAPPDAVAQTVDVATDPDVEKVGDEKESTKELDITDLVKSQKKIEDKQEQYFDNLFKHLTDLESRVEQMRPKTAQEKLELRSLDSGPFNQKLTDFFEDKQEDLIKTGKNEYVLTQDEVEDFSNADIKKSFRNFGDEEETPFNQIR